MRKNIYSTMLGFALVFNVTSYANAEDPKLVELDKSVTKYLQQADFHCTFIIRQGRAENFVDGLAGKFTDDEFLQAKGVFTRQGDKLLSSIDYDSFAEQQPDRYRSRAVMTDGRVIVSIHNRYKGAVFISKGVPLDSSQLPCDELFMHPLNIRGGSIKNLLAGHCPNCEPHQFKRRIVKEAGGIAEVETLLEEIDVKNPGKVTFQFTLNTNYDPPIFLGIRTVGENNGKITGYSEYQAAEHVKVGQVQIPTRIRAVIGSDKTKPCLTREWITTLVREPRAEDFEMQLQAGVKIYSLESPLDTTKPYELNLSDPTPSMLKENDLLPR